MELFKTHFETQLKKFNELINKLQKTFPLSSEKIRNAADIEVEKEKLRGEFEEGQFNVTRASQNVDAKSQNYTKLLKMLMQH